MQGEESKSADAMGRFGRITSIKDLPPKSTLLAYVKKARQLNHEDIRVPQKARPHDEKKDLMAPDDFLAAMKKNKKALRH